MTKESTRAAGGLGDRACFLSTNGSLSCLNNRNAGTSSEHMASQPQIASQHPAVFMGPSSSQWDDSGSQACHF